ncbi:ATP-binding protein [Kitasatospora acidiphila]|uniref:ATP-binding protein n=1 Tax=Kitasatospora acidiphila TaxID=2567942 RepID=UPI003C75B87C
MTHHHLPLAPATFPPVRAGNHEETTPASPVEPTPEHWDAVIAGAGPAGRFQYRFEYAVGPDLAHTTTTRHALIDAVRSWQLPLSGDALGDLALCAGELIANAIEHAGAPCKVSAQWTGATIRVEVWDPSPHAPEMHQARNGDLSGRGLLLVDALAQRWGWLPTQAGKTVWFECALTDTHTLKN